MMHKNRYFMIDLRFFLPLSLNYSYYPKKHPSFHLKPPRILDHASEESQVAVFRIIS